MKNDTKSIPRWLIVATVLAILVLLGGAFCFYFYEEQHLRRNAESNLQSAAHLKVQQIAEWRSEQLRDATVVMRSNFLIEAIEKFLTDPRPEIAQKVLSLFRSMQEIYHYHDVLLVDRIGQVRLALRSHSGSLHQETANAFAEAVEMSQPFLTDLHIGPGHLPPHIDVIAPLFSETSETKEPIGAVILQIDARKFLYPLIKLWPTPSPSAETLLVKGDGDHVLFLNELRHQSDTALKLRIPITRQDVPTVMAAMGKEGIVQGKDYRGVDVLAFLAGVPNSPWFMVAKVDETEVLADLRTRIILLLALVLSLLAFLATGIVMAWQKRRKEHYKELFLAEKALRKMEVDHRITLMSVGDGVITTDPQGQIELLNRVAETLTGWGQEEARGKPLEEVFCIINEETRQAVENPVSKALREGLVVGLANHSLLISKDGTERPIADSAAPIRDEQGNITGVVLVFRDQSEERAAQRLLLQEKEKAQQYLDVAGVMLVALDIDGRVTLINKKGCEILGCHENQILGKDWFEHFLPHNIRDEIKSVFHKIISGHLGMDEYTENVVLTKTGESKLIAWHNSILRDQNGSIIGTLSSGEDITERRRAEEALRESEERFRRLYEQSPLPYQSLDAKGNILYVNNAWLTELGYERDDVVGRWFGDFLADDHIKLFFERFEQLKKQGEHHGIEYEMKHKNGTTITASFEEKVSYNDKGEFLQTQSVFTNVTEARRAEAERERLVSAIEHAAEAVVVTDTEGTIVYVNPAFEKITGYTPEEAIGRNPRILKSGEHDNNFYRHLWNTIQGGDIWSGRFINKRKDGRLYREEATISPVKDASGKIINYVAVKRDITEHLELSRQLLQAQKMEAIGTLAGGVAHDFNNLLQVVLGYSEMILSDDTLPEIHRNDLLRVYQAAKGGADLVQRLLTFSRKTETKARPLNLNRRIRQLEKMLSRTIPKMIQIDLDLADDCKAINADPMQMEQILMNLAVNARDAMPEGGILIISTKNVTIDEDYAKTYLDARPGSYVLLQVSDTGFGMDTDTLEHIFEPFYTTKGPGEGTGLGLAMVYGIVKQHGGYIICESELGKGTTFKIYFPALLSDEELHDVREGQLPRGGSETILLVDDEELIRDLGSRILSKAGYTVITASNGSQALEIYKEKKQEISIIIMDLIMPEMGGKSCLEEILKINPDARVLIATGFSADSLTKEALVAGAKGFINKPYDMHKMLQIVRDVLDSV